jgi:hypothetical protein
VEHAQRPRSLPQLSPDPFVPALRARLHIRTKHAPGWWCPAKRKHAVQFGDIGPALTALGDSVGSRPVFIVRWIVALSSWATFPLLRRVQQRVTCKLQHRGNALPR